MNPKFTFKALCETTHLIQFTGTNQRTESEILNLECGARLCPALQVQL